MNKLQRSHSGDWLQLRVLHRVSIFLNFQFSPISSELVCEWLVYWTDWWMLLHALFRWIVEGMLRPRMSEIALITGLFVYCNQIYWFNWRNVRSRMNDEGRVWKSDWLVCFNWTKSNRILFLVSDIGHINNVFNHFGAVWKFTFKWVIQKVLFLIFESYLADWISFFNSWKIKSILFHLVKIRP